MALIKLVEFFDKELGIYCEEDVLEAFIAWLERLRVIEDDEQSAKILEKRIRLLRKVSKLWSKCNDV